MLHTESKGIGKESIIQGGEFIMRCLTFEMRPPGAYLTTSVGSGSRFDIRLEAGDELDIDKLDRYLE